MSKIALAPNAAGSAIFTIESPGTNTNRTLTLPDDTGTIVTNSGNQAGSFTTLNTSGQVVFNDAGADVDFRVEGDTDANLLFVDASADAVGIGTTSSLEKLTVATSGSNVYFKVTDGTVNTYLGVTNSTATAINGTISNHPYAFFTNNAERMRIDTSGNVGIGASTGLISGLSLARGSGVTALIETAGNGNTLGTTSVLYGQDSANNGYAWNRASSPMLFGTANNERARITSGGFFKASVDGTYINAGALHELKSNAATVAVAVTNSSATTPSCIYAYLSGATPNNTSDYFLRCEDTTNIKALIYSNGDFQSRTNSYTGISDVKLKQDIVDANSQWDDIKGLRVVKYRFKDEVAADPNYPSHLGVIAQEAEIVSPGLVFESPDFENVEVPVLDDEGNPVLNEDGTPQVTTERQATGTTTKAVKYSILYMKAVKALQEAMERIEALEAKVAALEAK